MKKLLYILAATSIAFSCEVPAKDKADNPPTLAALEDAVKENKDTASNKVTPPIAITSQSDPTEPWMAVLLKNYITHSGKELIRLAIKNKAREEWLFDQLIATDTAKYYVFHIGHDMAEKDSTDLRFITDQWVYIDSLTRKLYEYDLPNERLTEWKK